VLILGGSSQGIIAIKKCLVANLIIPSFEGV
jgi:hypothetical protein